jgi:hypothetical protein
VSRADRDPADVWYMLGCAEMYGLPVCIGIQPFDDSDATPPVYADAAMFAEGLRIAGYADGAIMWATDRLFRYPECAAKTAILNAIKNYRQLPRPERVNVLLPGDWRLHKAIARIVGDTGRCPRFTTDAGSAVITWDALPKPPEYLALLSKFYDLGAPNRPPDVRERVRACEREMAKGTR